MIKTATGVFAVSLTVATLLATSTSPVLAQQKAGNSNPIVDVFNVVVAPDGVVTEDLHSKLWATLRKGTDDQAGINKFWGTAAKQKDIIASRYIMEATRTTIQSMEKKAVTPTKYYEQVKSEFLAQGKTEAAKEKLRNAVAAWERNHRTVGTPEFRRTPEQIQNLREVVDIEFSKAIRPVYNFITIKEPVFKPRNYITNYTSLPFRMSWPGTFTYERQTVDTPGGNKLKIIMLNSQDANGALAKMVVYRIPVREGDEVNRAGSIVKGWMSDFGIASPKMGKQNWNELVTVRAKGDGNFQGSPVSVEARGFTFPDRQSIAVFGIISPNGEQSAGQSFNSLDTNIRFR